MKKFVNLFFAVLCAGVVLCSCTKEISNGEQSNDSEFSLCVLPSSPEEVGEAFPVTKSVFSDIDKVTDVNFFVFDTAGNLVSNNYFNSNSNISAKTLFLMTDGQRNSHSYSDSFDVYVIANVGDVHNDSYLTNQSLIGSYTFDFYSKDNLQSLIAAKGLPMAAIYEDYCPVTDTKSLLADRLVSEYHISFSSSNENVYSINSGLIKDMSSKVLPFGDAYCIASGDGCISSFEDFGAQSLNTSGYLTVYALENVHGSNPEKDYIYQAKNKSKANLKKEYQSNRVTYLELDVTVDDREAAIHEVKYRYYFGDGNNDFSVYRNKIVSLAITFEDMEIVDDGWRIDEQEVDPYIPELLTDVDDLYVAQKVTLTSNMACDWEIYESDNEDMVVLSGTSETLSTDLSCLAPGNFTLRLCNSKYPEGYVDYDFEVLAPRLYYRFNNSGSWTLLSNDISTTIFVDESELNFNYIYKKEDDSDYTDYDSGLYDSLLKISTSGSGWGNNHNYTSVSCSSGNVCVSIDNLQHPSDTENIFHYMASSSYLVSFNARPPYSGASSYSVNVSMKHPFADYISSGDTFAFPNDLFVENNCLLSGSYICDLKTTASRSNLFGYYIKNKSYFNIKIRNIPNGEGGTINEYDASSISSSLYSSVSSKYNVSSLSFNMAGGSVIYDSTASSIVSGDQPYCFGQLYFSFEFTNDKGKSLILSHKRIGSGSLSGSLRYCDSANGNTARCNVYLIVGEAMGTKVINSQRYFLPLYINNLDSKNLAHDLIVYGSTSGQRLGTVIKLSTSKDTSKYAQYSGDWYPSGYDVALNAGISSGINMSKLLTAYGALNPNTFSCSTSTDSHGNIYITSATATSKTSSLNTANYKSYAYFLTSFIFDTSKVTSYSWSSKYSYPIGYYLNTNSYVHIVPLSNITTTFQ